MKKRIFLSSPHMSGNEQKYIQEAFSTNWVAPLGPNVDTFEKDLASYVGSKYASATVSGTSAIHLALRLLNVGKGDTVFCSSLTFAASCNPILYQGATPVFIDSDYKTWNMSPKALKKAFEMEKQLPKAVIVVHLYGQSADMKEIKSICDSYNVPIIEDAAESLGATYNGQQTGTFGKYGIFSFNGNKIITTSGGGMLVSDDEDGIKKSRFLATQARDNAKYYQHSEYGYNYRMSNIVAGIGRAQLEVLNERIAKKKEIFNSYQEQFKDMDEIEMMPICNYGKPNYWLSVMTVLPVTTVTPIDIIEALEKENIESRHVWKPMHMQPLYKDAKFYSSLEDGSVSQDLFERGVCLPSDTKMTDEELKLVAKTIRKVFGK